MNYKKLCCGIFPGGSLCENSFRAKVIFKNVVLGFVLGGAFTGLASANPVFVYRQADGTVRFSTSKPKGIEAAVFTAKGVTGKGGGGHYSTYRGGRWNSSRWAFKGQQPDQLYQEKYDSVIRLVAQKYRVEPALVKAVIHTESRFNPEAVSRKGAMGLMQLMPTTARFLGVRHPFSISGNIEGGVKYLAKLLKLFKGNTRHCIAAYNAGEGAVAKYGGVPPYRETRDYVQKVLSLLERYRSIV
jgi:hypothetical protein